MVLVEAVEHRRGRPGDPGGQPEAPLDARLAPDRDHRRVGRQTLQMIDAARVGDGVGRAVGIEESQLKQRARFSRAELQDAGLLSLPGGDERRAAGFPEDEPLGFDVPAVARDRLPVVVIVMVVRRRARVIATACAEPEERQGGQHERGWKRRPPSVRSAHGDRSP
jgi:hypothetical protein